MADYSQHLEELRAADAICMKPEHQITTSVNGVNSDYPRWPNAFEGCEKIHQWFLETETMKNSEEDRQAVMRESYKLRR